MKTAIITIVLVLSGCYMSAAGVDEENVAHDDTVGEQTSEPGLVETGYRIRCFCFDMYDNVPDPDYIVCAKTAIGQRILEMDAQGTTGTRCENEGVYVTIDVDK